LSQNNPILEFKFESLKNGNELTNFLRSEKSISFILVSEPLPSSSGSGLSHCVDFALASVDLLEILEQTPNHLDSVQLLLDIHMNRNDPIANLPFENEAVLRPIGVLALTLRGLNFLHEVMDLSNSKIKANKLSQSDAAMDILLRVREDYTRKKQQSLSAYSLPSKPSLPISASFAKLLPGRKSQNVADASNSSLNSPKLRQDNSDIVSIDDLAERLFDG
jgi:hypothetical protein